MVAIARAIGEPCVQAELYATGYSAVWLCHYNVLNLGAARTRASGSGSNVTSRRTSVHPPVVSL